MDSNLNLFLDQNVLALAQDVLNQAEIREADALADQLINSKESYGQVIQTLQNKIGRIPKRPLYYLNYELTLLPDQTRDVARYAGDYIDQLMKHCSHEHTKFIKKLKSHYSSLGGNIKNTEKFLGSELYDILNRYNKFIYVPAKHNFDIRNKPHLFSAKEAIFICYITIALAQKLITLSKEAKAYSEQQTYEYYNS